MKQLALATRITLLLFIMNLLFGCNNNSEFVPKRTGYFRIALPEKKYTLFNKPAYPFTFEYPQYAVVLKDTGEGDNSLWLNVAFPQFKCNLYLSYIKIDTNLDVYVEDCRKFAASHEIKATAINEREISNPSEKIYGIIYDIEGNTATNLQFYVTDSARNFMRGVLYFYAVPNKDSLAPVLNFVKTDVQHLIGTFRWRNN